MSYKFIVFMTAGLRAATTSAAVLEQYV